MGFLDFLKSNDINNWLDRLGADSGAVLLDVRSPQEFREGHIPGSINLPLQSLDNVDEIIENEDTPIYVYCHSGARSRQAAEILGVLGYTNVKNIGGISAYSGKVEY